MARQIIFDLIGRTEKLSQPIDKFQRKLAGVGKKLGRVGTQLTRNVTLPILAIGAAATKAASDLAESQNAAEVAFKGQAGTIQDWAKNLDSAFGFTQKGALDAAAGFKLVAKDADLSAEDFTKLAERASDLGSVFNIETTQAADALRSALVGEFEPARRLGVVLNAAQVEARAAALGFDAVGGALDPAAKQAAIYSLIMEQTADAQGDATATAGTTAGQARTLKSEMGKLSETIGTKLLPIATKLIGWARGMINRFSELSGRTQNIILVVLGAAAAIGPLLKVGQALITIIRGISLAMAFLAANPIVLVIAAVAALAFGIFKLWQTSQTFRDVVTGAFRAVADAGLWLWNHALRPVFDLIIGNFRRMISLARGAINVARTVSRVVGSVGRFLGFQTGGIVPGVPGQPVPIMAHGGERIVPASQAARGAGGGGGGPITVNLTLDGRTLASILVDPVRRQLLRTSSRNVNVGLA